jgi:DNA-binding CsgD family transcriptional regulator/PAS domain-containing protein
MSHHERTLAVIESFYDAALDEALWPAALKQLTELTHSQAASFWVLDGSETPRLPTFICINFDTTAIQEYLDHTASIDPTVQYLVAHPEQSVVHDGLVISEREKDKHPYYDWHERLIDTRFRMVGQARLMPAVQAGVALHRTRRAGRYEPRDIKQFEVLHRHLKKALAIAFRLGSLGALQKLTAEWLDRNSAAVIFLDDRKRIVFANRRAQELQADADGIRLRAGEIALFQKQDDDRFQSLIARALSPTACPMSSGGAMRVHRPSGKRPYTVLVGPVAGKYPVLSSIRPAVCLAITDAERQTPLPAARLQQVFGLTAAEARLAVLLATGQELRRAAEQLGITYGTARVALSQIFQKTDTRRQAELVRILLMTFIPP